MCVNSYSFDFPPQSTYPIPMDLVVRTEVEEGGRSFQGLPPLSPIIKWLGGKRWLVPVVRELYSPHRGRRLVEPFAGGAAVSLGLRPKEALLNDVNKHLINLYLWIKRGLKPDPSIVPFVNSSEVYYRNRDRFNQLISSWKWDTIEAALLFYYLNKTCYNGLSRFNSKGLFNAPYGRHKKINYAEDFSPYREAFSSWTISLGDFRSLDLDPDDFVYADPPYPSGFTKYAGTDFSWQDHVELAHWLASHPGPVVVSNAALPEVEELYRGLGFDITFVSAPRNVSADVSGRGKVREILAFRGI
jgi:DNA adenine methylase